jgi:hypothetical protein
MKLAKHFAAKQVLAIHAATAVAPYAATASDW